MIRKFPNLSSAYWPLSSSTGWQEKNIERKKNAAKAGGELLQREQLVTNSKTVQLHHQLQNQLQVLDWKFIKLGVPDLLVSEALIFGSFLSLTRIPKSATSWSPLKATPHIWAQFWTRLNVSSFLGWWVFGTLLFLQYLWTWNIGSLTLLVSFTLREIFHCPHDYGRKASSQLLSTGGWTNLSQTLILWSIYLHEWWLF